jgi:hypothetical protein
VGIHTVEVLSLDGKAMSTQEINFQHADQSLDVHQLQPGMYIIRSGRKQP